MYSRAGHGRQFVAGNAARKRIAQITAEVEVGKIYESSVLRLLDFGAIVRLLPEKD